MKVMVIQIVVDAFGMVTKGKRLKELKIRERMENTQTIALLKSARILWRVLETR